VSRRARQFVKHWTPLPPRPVPEIVLSPSLGAPLARPPAALLPPVICVDPWRDFTESLYPLRVGVGQKLNEIAQLFREGTR